MDNKTAGIWKNLKKWINHHIGFFFFSIVTFMCACIMLIMQIIIMQSYKDNQKRILLSYASNVYFSDTMTINNKIDSLFDRIPMEPKMEQEAKCLLKGYYDITNGNIHSVNGINKVSSADSSMMYNSVKDLLELQYNKLQNEYDSIQIWYGVLTVIFLVFSFYSIFKADDVIRQGKDAIIDFTQNATNEIASQKADAEEIKTKIKDRLDDGLKSIDVKAQANIEAINELQQSFQDVVDKSNDDLENRIKDVNILLQKVEVRINELRTLSLEPNGGGKK